MLRRKQRSHASSSSSSGYYAQKDDGTDSLELTLWMKIYLGIAMLLLIASVVLISITLADVEMFHDKVKHAVHKYPIHKMFERAKQFDFEKISHALTAISHQDYGDYFKQLLKYLEAGSGKCESHSTTHPYRPYESQFLGLYYGRYRKGRSELVSEPNPRYVSNVMMAYGGKKQTGKSCEILPNGRGMSAWVWQWGQFIDHEFSLTRAGEQYGVIEVDIKCDPVADPHCKGKHIRMSRSKYSTDSDGIRQQVNELTAYLDASAVYGSSYERYKQIRAYEYGRLHTSAGDLLPFNEAGLPNEGGDGVKELFLGGDVRANEQLGLTCTHTLWVREHNSWAERLYKLYPDWDDEQLYWTARRIVTAEIQAITYNEFLPALLGKAADPKHYNDYKKYGMPPPKYDADVDSSMMNEFATAGYRFGHSMVGESLLLYDAENDKRQCLPLRDTFFKPSTLNDVGMEAVLAGLAHQPAEEVDTLLVDSLRNFLHFAEFIDLASLNIMRGRDHGLPSYSELHYRLTGKYIKDWSDITSNSKLQRKLKSVYGDWKSMDAWVGILAEDAVNDSSLGITGTTMLIDQFRRIRDGDPYYYEWDAGLPNALKHEIHSTKLAEVIVRNSKLQPHHLPHNVFYVAN